MIKGNSINSITGIFVFSILLCSLAAATQFQGLAGFKSHELANDLYTLKSNQSNTNSGVYIGKDSILLIDPVVGSDNNSKLVNAIRELSDKPIKYVFNTHEHMDHSGANGFYQELGATIVSYGNHSTDNHTQFEDKYTVNMGVEQVSLYHVPSHSNSDVIIHFAQNNVIFVGDTYMHDMYPHAYIGGSKGLYDAIEKTLSLSNDSTQIVTAHGRFTTSKSAFLKFKENAVSWYQRIEWLNKEGLDVEQISQDPTLRQISLRFKPLSEDNLKKRIAQTIKAESKIH